LSVPHPERLPKEGFPEAAFVGRSNVGKSSLIQVLLGQKGLVRISARPGCTRSINFFLINERWFFVDLPGYGYAAVSKEIKAGWSNLIMTYLEQRRSLAAVVLLQDGRRLPGPEELFLWELFRSQGRPIIPVLTKADKLKRGERARQLAKILPVLQPFQVAAEDFLWFSAHTQEGKDKLWGKLLASLEA